MIHLRGLTYGAELEFGDIDRNKPTVDGCGWDTRDFTMVNSNGIAVDPRGTLYKFGGEINTKPTDSIEEQVLLFKKILRHYPEAAVNYRSNLHIHIRIPGLAEDLVSLKLLQKYIHEELPKVIDLIEPIPAPELGLEEGEYIGSKRRYNRRKVSHHTFLTPKRLSKQLEAKSIKEFFEAEVPRSRTGAVMWHAQPRVCVNVRQLRETDTIEFRHFPLTLSVEEFYNALNWCYTFLYAAFNGVPCLEIWKQFSCKEFPKFPPYVHWMEKRYRRTCHDGTLSKEQISKNIKEILYEDSRNLCGELK